MEFILVIGIWLALGVLHVPILKYWWTERCDWTVVESRLSWCSAVLGPFILIVSILLVVISRLSKQRPKWGTGGDRVITKRRK
jgi:hypothetical protein